MTTSIQDAPLSNRTDTPIYDNPAFFSAYMHLPRQTSGLASAPEWPLMRALLGDLKDANVLDLGCGVEWFARYAVENGARGVRAVDVSERMIEQAREMGAGDGRIEYLIGDLSDENLDFGGGAGEEKEGYDVVHSSLTLHYLSTEAFQRVLKKSFDVLKPGGRLVFSCEHPIYTAPLEPRFLDVILPSPSSATPPQDLQHPTAPIWPPTHYAHSGIRRTTWLGSEVTKYHRTLEGILGGFLEAGFRISGVRECVARKEDLKTWGFGEGEGSRPMFLVVGGLKFAEWVRLEVERED